MDQTTQDNRGLMVRLAAQGLGFVVIGGVCAIYYGSRVNTFDLDICCELNVSNLQKIHAALKDLHPRHRLTANKLPLEINEELASRLKNLYLNTDLGKLDCLSMVAGVGGYKEVLRNSQVSSFSYGEFRFLTIEALIRAKEAVGREKDQMAVKHLRCIAERKKAEKQRDLNF